MYGRFAETKEKRGRNNEVAVWRGSTVPDIVIPYSRDCERILK